MKGISMGRQMPSIRALCSSSRRRAGSSQSYRYAALLKMMFECANARFRIVKNRGCERGVGAACGEHVDEVAEGAGPARRDHRNGHRARHGAGQLAVETDLRA